MRVSFAAVLVVLTLGAFLARGLMYASIGSWVPLIAALSFAVPIALSRLAGPRLWVLATRVWGVSLVLYGVARLGLAGLVRVAETGSMHAVEATGLAFVALSVVDVAIGGWLTVRKSPRT